MYAWGNIHTEKIIGMYVCLGKHTYLENDRYVCMYVWGNIHTIHTLKNKGMYVCLGKHTYLENYRYVCMSGETYIPRNYRYVCMLKVCMCVWGNIHT